MENMDKKLLDEYLIKLKRGDNEAFDGIYHLTKRGGEKSPPFYYTKVISILNLNKKLFHKKQSYRKWLNLLTKQLI